MSSIRVLVSLPEKFLEELDSVAENEQRTRSELIREAFRMYLRQRYPKKTPEGAASGT